MKKRKKTNTAVKKHGRQVSEGTLIMIKEYPKLKSQGLTDAQIANKFGLNKRTIYVHIDDICNYHHMTREELGKVKYCIKNNCNRRKAVSDLSEGARHMIESYLDFLSMGFSDKAIAEACGITTHTIRYHLENICVYHGISMKELQNKRQMRPGGCRDERSQMFIRDFLSLREQGYSIWQIAEKCNLHGATGYSLLEEVAKYTGKPREELLIAPHKGHQKKDVVDTDDDSITELKEKFEGLCDRGLTEDDRYGAWYEVLEEWHEALEEE